MAANHRPVLLAMDFQNGIAGDEAFTKTGVLERAHDAVAAAREKGIPVIWVRVALREGHPELVETASFGQIAAHGDLDESHASTSIHETLGRHEGEPIVTKRRISAFTGSDLEVLLRGYGADILILAGVATSGVVLSTIRQAADLDFRLTVLSDACADRDEEVHRVLTEKVFPKQATVLTVDDWAAHT
ncbi:isochorismatase family cysteine hydrolase [Brevibacterium sp. RIT 803]|uniref:cysteine hydrolase family protein n=1 Tax=Brevibacterium sp. RIT 803 TaxID=2810210 RepID=UPI001950CFF1|nr:isochorismatase family cysteine hydrolase [Brevibacterium sp. RIT 803]MBM6589029.1 cysteine hydrolase [Brevibacterium sp. RIT 803]